MQEIAAVPKGAASLHGHIPGHLLHPRLVRMNGDPGDVHPAALEMDEKQHVVGHQPAQREHLRREEVGARQQRQVGPNECRPRCRALALWCGRQSVTLQDIADRLIADLIPQIGQRPRNPVIAPITVLLGHANDQLLDFSLDPRPTGASRGFRAIEFAGDQLAVPGQDSVRPGHIGHLAENLAAQSMTDLTERGSLGVRESRPSFQLRLQDAVFGGQIFVPRQQPLVHHPGDVSQDACPIHNCPLPLTSAVGAVARPENRSQRNTARLRREGTTPHLFYSFNFLT